MSARTGVDVSPLLDSLRATLDPSIEVVEMENNINDTEFADAVGIDSSAIHRDGFGRAAGAGQIGMHGLEIEHEFRGFRGVARRSAFLVNQTGTIRGAWAYEDAEVPDFDVLLAAAKLI